MKKERFDPNELQDHMILDKSRVEERVFSQKPRGVHAKRVADNVPIDPSIRKNPKQIENMVDDDSFRKQLRDALEENGHLQKLVQERDDTINQLHAEMNRLTTENIALQLRIHELIQRINALDLGLFKFVVFSLIPLIP